MAPYSRRRHLLRCAGKTVPWPQINFDHALSGKSLHYFCRQQIENRSQQPASTFSRKPMVKSGIVKVDQFLGKEILVV